jgi:imidazolonepropionase
VSYSLLEYEQSWRYIDLIIDEIIPEIAKHKVAQFIDGFWNRYFIVAETEQIIKVGIIWLKAKKFMSISSPLEFNQVKYNAIVIILRWWPQILNFENTRNYACGIVLLLFQYSLHTCRNTALDFPLSTCIWLTQVYPSGNMNFVVATASLKWKWLKKHINAATINGAYAMGIWNLEASQ